MMMTSPWFDAHEDFDLWYDTSETMNDYIKWGKPPNICENIGISNESTNKHIKSDFLLANVKLNSGTFEADYITVC